MINLDLSIEEIREKIIAFKNDTTYQKLFSLYSSTTYAEVLGVERRELSHSNFLAWLLDPYADHNLGDFAIKRFLDLLVQNSSQQHTEKNSTLYNIIVSENYEVRSYEVIREFTLRKNDKKSKAGRLDLLLIIKYRSDGVEGKLKIVIENKVKSVENNDQTQRYYEFFQQELQHENNLNFLFVYLTATPNYIIQELLFQGKKVCKNDNFIPITYQDVVNSVLERALISTTNSRTQFLIKDYINTLSQPAHMLNEENKNKEIIMALGQEEKELLKQFWEKNEDLILAAMYAIRTSDDTDEEQRKEIGEAIDSLSKTSRKNRSRFNIYFKDLLRYSNFLKADIGLKTILLLSEESMIDDEIFEFLKEDKSCRHNLIKSKSEVTPTEKKYAKYKIDSSPEFNYNGQNYYVARNWGIESTRFFIEKIEKKFQDFRFEEVLV